MQEERLCVLCPRSVHRRRQNHILQASLLHTHPAHVSYIQENAIRQVSFNSTQSVCHRCWQRVDRNVLNPVQNPVEHEPEVSPPVPVPILVPPLQNDVQGSNDGELYVPSYKRAPNTSSHCIFGACSNENRRRIPKTIKLYMITTHQLYIPQHARVCREHLESNMWDELENHCTISHYFTAEHFTNVCNIFTEGIISNKQYDFETMVGLNDDSLHFWVGLNGKNCVKRKCAKGKCIKKKHTKDKKQEDYNQKHKDQEGNNLKLMLLFFERLLNSYYPSATNSSFKLYAYCSTERRQRNLHELHRSVWR
ncbi:hypothetical protein PYW08_006264 [Mythimna loreyi]|uniref:Uncharacterized protein n=1 Tax=Mythimna loreyi TaxID=667449 RepID=A0ACC2QP34_9NEOP|nr:hypothetical protein PYW08_006264 [Mythimna loreyi]